MAASCFDPETQLPVQGWMAQLDNNTCEKRQGDKEGWGHVQDMGHLAGRAIIGDGGLSE